jgi:D-glycero-D-manno-heptose 1,7-bisphosphate phosphatase
MYKQKCVFLDRDGVINHAILKNRKPYSPRDLSEFRIIDDCIENIDRIKNMGFLRIIITNQPDVSSGNLSLNLLKKFHNLLFSQMSLTDIYYCTHLDIDSCFCRKPGTGMIDAAVEKYNIDLKKSFVIGDRWRDVDCGVKAGCKTIFIDYNYNEKLNYKPSAIVKNLSSAVNLIQKWN